jgi:hypothetical protein
MLSRKTSGAMAVGCQPLPTRAARRIAARLTPPIKMGMWGFALIIGQGKAEFHAVSFACIYGTCP